MNIESAHHLKMLPSSNMTPLVLYFPQNQNSRSFPHTPCCLIYVCPFAYSLLFDNASYSTRVNFFLLSLNYHLLPTPLTFLPSPLQSLSLLYSFFTSQLPLLSPNSNFLFSNLFLYLNDKSIYIYQVHYILKYIYCRMVKSSQLT